MADILTEEELIEILGVNKIIIAKYRKAGLAFCRLSKTERVYIVKDILDFIVERRIRVSDDS